MLVYTQGEMTSLKRSFSLLVCPAADIVGEECPADWLDEQGKPLNIEVEFCYGRAEVPSNLGRYLISHGLAARSSLIIPDGVKVA